jgi:hypothetical protein
MTAETYINATEVAVRDLFSILDKYDSTYLPSLSKYTNENGEIHMSKSENEAFLQAHVDYMDLDFARATLAGSILQVAFIALKQYSPGLVDPALCQKFGIKNGNLAEKFCIGRQIHEIPLGLLIYAGRVQYNHWEEGLPNNPVVQGIFQKLVWAYYDNMLMDLVYDLGGVRTYPVPHYIVRVELKWRNYEDYLNDLKLLLKV